MSLGFLLDIVLVGTGKFFNVVRLLDTLKWILIISKCLLNGINLPTSTVFFPLKSNY